MSRYDIFVPIIITMNNIFKDLLVFWTLQKFYLRNKPSKITCINMLIMDYKSFLYETSYLL